MMDGKTETVEQTTSKTDRRRFLLLLGEWTMPQNRLDFSCELSIVNQFHLEGTIRWQAQMIWGRVDHFQSWETVSGIFTPPHIELKGMATGKDLDPDHYKITLESLANRGLITGMSRSCQMNWSGKIRGTFMFY